MKYRAGNSKIKYEHGMIDGLRELLETIEPWEEIRSIIPGVIKTSKSRHKLLLRIQYETPTGLKCQARGGLAVQEVFFVTSEPEKLQKRLEQFTAKDGNQ